MILVLEPKLYSNKQMPHCTPTLLALWASLRGHGRLPKNRCQLYQQAVTHHCAPATHQSLGACAVSTTTHPSTNMKQPSASSPYGLRRSRWLSPPIAAISVQHRLPHRLWAEAALCRRPIRLSRGPAPSHRVPAPRARSSRAVA